jgi:hypothetical protein
MVVWAGEFHPGPNPKPDVQVSKHLAFQMFLDYGNASALGRMPPQSIAADASGLLLRLFPQSSLDHFHVHREPSRLVNPSVAQNETSCRPSPCDRLSRPRTTTTAPPLVRLVGETWEGVNLPGCAITLLGRASLVPLLTLKRPRLGFDSLTPNSGLLLPRNIAK